MKGGKSYFYTALSAFLILRAFAFSYFSGNYTDSDQCVMWEMANDFANFRFHTPFFYGQLYSSGLEAWLAAPFIWLGIPVYRAVPLATTLMSTLPWIWMAQLSIKKHGHHKNATALLLLSLLFPVSWLQTTYISRGFMQSIFLISLATRYLKNNPFSVSFSLVLVTWGLLQNTNGLLLLPAVMPHWLDQMPTRLRTRIQWLLPGILASVVLVFLYRYLAQVNPDWMIHGTIQLSFSWNDFGANILRFNTLLQHTYPATPVLGAMLIAVITWTLFQSKSLLQKLAFWGTMVLPLAVFGLSKISDGTENIFFGYGRFFLAIPFAWGFLWANSTLQIPTQLKTRFHQLGLRTSDRLITLTNKTKYRLYLVFTLLSISGYAYLFWEKTSIREFGKTYIPVMVYPINQLKQDAEAMAQLCRKDTIGAVVVLDHFVLECGSMGFPLMAQFPFKSGTPKQLPNGAFPFDTLPILSIPIEIGPSIFKIHETIPIVRPKYERRHWLLKEIKEQNYIPKKVAVMDVWKDSTWGTQWPFKRSMADVRGRVFIFETGELPLSQFIENYLTSIP